MKTESAKINEEEFGIDQTKMIQLQEGLKVSKAERELLMKDFEDVSKLGVTKENLPKFKALRLKLVKNRTQGVDVWHKNGKEVSLRLGQFYDAVKRAENQINQSMESKLMDAEKHFENLEKEKALKLQESRCAELRKYSKDGTELPLNLGEMPNEIWNNYLTGTKTNFEASQLAEKKAEAERLEKERSEKVYFERRHVLLPYQFHIDIDVINRKSTQEDYEKTLKDAQEAKAKSDKEKEQRKKDNERLEKEAESKEKARVEAESKAAEVLKKEQEAKAKIEAELQSKKDADIKAESDRKEAEQAELNKGDAAKKADLIAKLKAIKSKYVFKSEKNKKMYSNVAILIDKVVNHIK